MGHLEGQGVEADEAPGVLGAVGAAVVLHGDRAGVVEGIGGLAAGDLAAAPVEFQPYGAGDGPLGLAHHGEQHLHLRREPVAVVDQLGEAGHEGVFQVDHAPVQGDRLHGAMGDVQDRAAGSLVDAAGLHAHVARLHHVDPPHAVPAPGLVEAPQQGRRAEPLAVDRHGEALLEADQQGFGRVRGLAGGRGQLEHFGPGRFPGVFQHARLEADVEQVLVAAPGLLQGGLDGDGVPLAIGDQFAAAGIGLEELGLLPGRDHLDLRVERVIAQLEAHLVVALAGGAVGHVGRPLGPGRLDLRLGDQRAGQRGAQQVGALVDRVELQRRKDEIAHEFLLHVLHQHLRRPGPGALLANLLQVLHLLAQVQQQGDHLEALSGHPMHDNRGVQSAGIGQHHFLFSHLSPVSPAADVRMGFGHSRPAAVTVRFSTVTIPSAAAVGDFSLDRDWGGGAAPEASSLPAFGPAPESSPFRPSASLPLHRVEGGKGRVYNDISQVVTLPPLGGEGQGMGIPPSSLHKSTAFPQGGWQGIPVATPESSPPTGC